MDKSYNSESSRNNRRAWRWFELHGYPLHKGMVLHHKDMTMKARDPWRYAQWRPEDLQPMDKAEHRRIHMRLHMKGRRHTETHNLAIRRSLIEARSPERSSQRVLVYRAETMTARIFDTRKAAAEWLGCTKQLVSQCVRPNAKNKTARGFTVQLVD